MNIYITGNALVGPVVAVLYATMIYKQRKWSRRQTLLGKADASIKKYLSLQAKITAMLTKLVIVYCILVSTNFSGSTHSKIARVVRVTAVVLLRSVIKMINRIPVEPGRPGKSERDLERYFSANSNSL